MFTRIQGIPCEVEVTYYVAPEPMRITGMGFGDAEPPVHEEVEFKVLDRKGYAAEWLENKMTAEDYERIVKELLENEDF